MLHKSLDDLDYSIRLKAKLAIENIRAALKDEGYDVAISETKRDMDVQMAYYSRGRMQAADVKRMYAAAGLYEISTKEAETKNTWTLFSNHLKGHAIDLVPTKDGKPAWNAPERIWKIMGEAGKGCGLKWGGDWEQKDLPHFEG